jgi:hypothetical protein
MSLAMNSTHQSHISYFIPGSGVNEPTFFPPDIFFEEYEIY